MLRPNLLEIYQKNELIQKILHYLLIKCKKKKKKKSETLRSVSILSSFSFSLLLINNCVILTHFEVTLPQKNVCTRLYLKFKIELKCGFLKCILRIFFFWGGEEGVNTWSSHSSCFVYLKVFSNYCPRKTEGMMTYLFHVKYDPMRIWYITVM